MRTFELVKKMTIRNKSEKNKQTPGAEMYKQRKFCFDFQSRLTSVAIPRHCHFRRRRDRCRRRRCCRVLLSGPKRSLSNRERRDHPRRSCDTNIAPIFRQYPERVSPRYLELVKSIGSMQDLRNRFIRDNITALSQDLRSSQNQR